MDFEQGMEIALEEAKLAFDEGETPVGAALFQGDTLIAKAHNLTAQHHDPTLHAEMLVMREAYQKLGNLHNCTLFVTMEPCAMCAGAMIHMKLPRLVFGAFDPRCGCCGSTIDLTDHWFYHSVETWGGILSTPCSTLLTTFYKNLRDNK